MSLGPVLPSFRRGLHRVLAHRPQMVAAGVDHAAVVQRPVQGGTLHHALEVALERLHHVANRCAEIGRAVNHRACLARFFHLVGCELFGDREEDRLLVVEVAIEGRRR